MNQPTETSFKAVHDTLLNIVSLSLDSDKALLPRSAKKLPALAQPDADGIDDGSDSSTPTSRQRHHDAPQVPGLDDLELHDADDRDPDDFTIMDEVQARRIVSLCQMAFGVEMTPDVVVADANVGLLTKRILGARSLTEPKAVYGGGPGAKMS